MCRAVFRKLKKSHFIFINLLRFKIKTEQNICVKWQSGIMANQSDKSKVSTDLDQSTSLAQSSLIWFHADDKYSEEIHTSNVTFLTSRKTRTEYV